MNGVADVSQEDVRTESFALGLDAGPVGRWTRLILGSIIPLYRIVWLLLTEQPSLRFLAEAVVYFGIIFAIYLAAHYFLGERLLARVNPWVGTLILVGPPTLALVFALGPPAFQLALALYIAISLFFNFTMSYGGCEVTAIPSLIFRRRYVVYCPWNVVDVVDKVIENR
ncbi:MAG: DUF6410 domain-containing protein [Anaerolineales bacterium]